MKKVFIKSPLRSDRIISARFLASAPFNQSGLQQRIGMLVYRSEWFVQCFCNFGCVVTFIISNEC